MDIDIAKKTDWAGAVVGSFRNAAFLIAVVLPGFASAEKADREKELQGSSASFTKEETADGAVFNMEGDVVFTQGTLRIAAARAVLTQTGDGNTVELTGADGKQIAFRQKREGLDEYVDASADRAHYNETSGVLRLFSNVRFKSGSDVAKGEYMLYNSITEKIELRAQLPEATSGTAKPVGRVTIEMTPKTAAPKK